MKQIVYVNKEKERIRSEEKILKYVQHVDCFIVYLNYDALLDIFLDYKFFMYCMNACM